MPATRKETIEYDEKFLTNWNNYCDTKGYVKRQASHACRIAFMKMSAEQREAAMHDAMVHVNSSRSKHQK